MPLPPAALPISVRAGPRLTLTTLMTLMLSSVAAAHTDSGFPVDVDHALIEPGGTRGTTVLKLRLHNNGSDVVHLLGVQTPVAEASRIIVATGEGRSHALSSLGIQPDESLDFATSHMRIELHGVSGPLAAGMHVPLRLLFTAEQWIDVVADVGRHHDH